MTMIYRVQDSTGRGPFRPGFSRSWIDEYGDRPLPADIISAFGIGWKNLVPANHQSGCGCRTLDGILAWFTPTEQQKLKGLGFSIVKMKVDSIIAENADQVIFTRERPFNDGATILSWKLNRSIA